MEEVRLIETRLMKTMPILALAGLTLLNLAAAVLTVLLPFLAGRAVFFYLPLLEYFGLTALVVGLTGVRRLFQLLAKNRRAGTFIRT